MCLHVYVCLCMCVCVYRTNCYIPRLYVENKVPLGFSWRFQDMHCVASVENALFRSSGDIHHIMQWSYLWLTDYSTLCMVDDYGYCFQMVVCQLIHVHVAAVQYMHVLRQPCQGFCTIVLHSGSMPTDTKQISNKLVIDYNKRAQCVNS